MNNNETLSIFEYQDYKAYVNDWIKRLPKAGYGAYKRLADYLRVNTVVVSQIFNGTRELSLEHAFEVTKYMALSQLERDYFITLVNSARAGTQSLKEYYSTQRDELKKLSKQIKNRIQQDRELTYEEKAIFYSSWPYSAVRLAASFNNIKSVEDLSQLLKMDRIKVGEIVEFLLTAGLIKKTKSGFEIAARVTHVDNRSPFVIKHHTNWRVKALQSLDDNRESDLHYTGPMALSEKAVEQIREKLILLIKEATQKAAASESEKLYCMTIDWFDFGKYK